MNKGTQEHLISLANQIDRKASDLRSLKVYPKSSRVRESMDTADSLTADIFGLTELIRKIARNAN